jgi:hypothetical protein
MIFCIAVQDLAKAFPGLERSRVLLHFYAKVALTQMRAPSCLLAVSSRSVTLMVSPYAV